MKAYLNFGTYHDAVFLNSIRYGMVDEVSFDVLNEVLNDTMHEALNEASTEVLNDRENNSKGDRESLTLVRAVNGNESEGLTK